MNLHYLVSVFASRSLTLITLILLSHVLTPQDFGTFNLIYTNALFANVILGAWVSNFAWREISKADEERIGDALDHVSQMIVAAAVIQSCIAAMIIFAFPDRLSIIWVIVTTLWSIANLFYDTTLVIENSTGSSKEYTRLTVTRNILFLLLTVLLALLGAGLTSVLWGAVGSSLLAVALSRRFWSLWAVAAWNWPPRRARSMFAAMKFGYSSVIALNIYMIVNAVSRNIILVDIGPEAAGRVSLLADLFFAPVALFSSAISLTSIPEMYRKQGPEGGDPDVSNFVSLNLIVVLPYILGGVFVAARLTAVLLDRPTAAAVSLIAPFAVVQSGCLALLASLTTIALTKGRIRTGVGIAVGAALNVAIFQLAVASYNSLYLHALAAATGVLLTTLVALIGARPLLGIVVPTDEVLKVLAACGAMCLFLAVADPLRSPVTPFLEIFLGGIIFLGVAMLLSSSAVKQLSFLGRR